MRKQDLRKQDLDGAIEALEEVLIELKAWKSGEAPIPDEAAICLGAVVTPGEPVVEAGAPDGMTRATSINLLWGQGPMLGQLLQGLGLSYLEEGLGSEPGGKVPTVAYAGRA